MLESTREPEPPANLQPLLEEAMELHLGGALAQAEALYRRILVNDPRHFTALHQVGVLKNQQGDFEGAAQSLREALRLHPRSAMAHFNLGLSLWSLNRLEEALSHYEYSLVINPNNPDALLNCSVTLAGLGRPEEALVRLDRLLAAAPQHPEALQNRAILLAKRNDAGPVPVAGGFLKLNMGCGFNRCPGFINVDMFPECAPDLLCDLETIPWVWENDTVDEVLFNHSLEHLGADSRVFLAMMKELYRVSRHDCKIHINVPHPRHDDFLGDPTHVRIVTPQILRLFSQRLNNEWQQKGVANSQLATYLNVDFELESVDQILAEPYASLFEAKKISQDELTSMIREKNNMIVEIRMVLRVVKP